MEKKTKFNIWYLLMAIWGILLLQNLIFSQFRPTIIPYSDFIQAVMEDKVIEIAVGQDRINGKMKGEEEGEQVLFSTVRVDTDLSKALAEHKVKFTGQVETLFSKPCCHGCCRSSFFSDSGICSCAACRPARSA